MPSTFTIVPLASAFIVLCDRKVGDGLQAQFKDVSTIENLGYEGASVRFQFNHTDNDELVRDMARTAGQAVKFLMNI